MHPKASSFQIELPVFEGPFDLLLFFIERDELDIHDIPISEIGTLFFAHIQAIDELDLELSGDFIRIAARLIQIKARTLLPIEETLPEEEEDPRAALAEQLILYKEVKAQSEELRQLAEARAQMCARGNRNQAFEALEEHFNAERSLRTLSLHKLLLTYRNCLNREKERSTPSPRHQVWRYPYTVPHKRAIFFSD